MTNWDNLLECLVKIYSNLVRPSIQLLFRVYYGRCLRSKVHLATDDMLFYSASFIAKQIRNKQFKSEDVLRSYILRIKEIQPTLNCVVDERFEEALKEAREIDRLIETDSLDEEVLQKRPLLGVPFACAESMGVKEMSFSTGLMSRKFLKASSDSRVVESMRQAGAIPVCVTMTSELDLWIDSSNHVYGQCRNLYDTRRCVGGSSGGLACLIASQGNTIGLGSDLFGSLRLSAAFNGVFAHKPTNGLTSNEGTFPVLNVDQCSLFPPGPICRYSEDLELVLKVLIGDNQKRLINYDNLDLKNVKFYYVDRIESALVSQVSIEVQLAHFNFINFLEKTLNVRVQRLNRDEKLFKNILNLIGRVMNTNGQNKCLIKLMSNVTTSDTQYVVQKFKKPLNELLKWIVGTSDHTLPTLILALVEKQLPTGGTSIDQIRDELKSISRDFETLLGDDGVLICPSYPTLTPYHNQSLLTNPVDALVYGCYFNLIGLPCTQVPLGLVSNDHLPVGIQLLAGKYCDRLTIRLAQFIEKQIGGWLEPHH